MVEIELKARHKSAKKRTLKAWHLAQITKWLYTFAPNASTIVFLKFAF
ncbi:MAG: hypothetical protein ACOX7G_06955 [Candidatus Scatomorpha sp.]|jgi:hypothetical protein